MNLKHGMARRVKTDGAQVEVPRSVLEVRREVQLDQGIGLVPMARVPLVKRVDPVPAVPVLTPQKVGVRAVRALLEVPADLSANPKHSRTVMFFF